MYKIGDTIKIKRKTYSVIGVNSEFYTLSCNGKQYTASVSGMEKFKRESEVEFPYLEQRLRQRRIFKKDATLPKTEQEVMLYFEQLVGELSPENLTCDGELSRSMVQAKLRNIRGAWKELEKIIGRKVTEDEVESSLVKRVLG